MRRLLKFFESLFPIALVAGQLFFCGWLVVSLIPFFGGELLGGVFAMSIAILALMAFALFNQFLGI